MKVELGLLVRLFEHATAIGIIIYWVVDAIREWRGRISPELKIIGDNMERLHQDLRELIAKIK